MIVGNCSRIAATWKATSSLQSKHLIFVFCLYFRWLVLRIEASIEVSSTKYQYYATVIGEEKHHFYVLEKFWFFNALQLQWPWCRWQYGDAHFAFHVSSHSLPTDERCGISYFHGILVGVGLLYSETLPRVVWRTWNAWQHVWWSEPFSPRLWNRRQNEKFRWNHEIIRARNRGANVQN